MFLKVLRNLLKVSLCIAFASTLAQADIKIPIEYGSVLTCVGRLYSDILGPSGWGQDDGAATRFVQSPEGILGVTIFFEIGPYGLPSSYSSSGTSAMIGVGTTSLNRWWNNDAILNVNDHGEQSKGGVIAVIKKSDAWHHESYHGNGDLLESQRNRFENVMNSDPQSLDCGGLINSWYIAQNVISVYYGTSYPPAKSVAVNTHVAPQALYYGSATSIEDINLPGVSYVNTKYVQLSGIWQVPNFPSGQYYEHFFLLTNAQPRAGYGPFIN